MSENAPIVEQEFVAYAVGLVCASACTSLDDEAATVRMNFDNPTGIDSRWTIADEPFADGTPNPSPCHDAPETRRHLLFTC